MADAALGDLPLAWADLPPGPLWLRPPTLGPAQARAFARLRAAVPVEPNTVWVLSSGTESIDRVKCLGLSRDAVLASAAAVNRHLGASARDRWAIAIPRYHVGGFAIAARAHLSRSPVDVFATAWDADAFVDACAAWGTTLTSLVPTQIHDLVATGRAAPSALRAIVVGGGALDPALYRRARALGWPALPSYGLTETASQVATARPDDPSDPYPDLTVLPHAEIQMRDGVAWIRATSLAHVRAVAGETGDVVVDDPRVDGWLPTADLGVTTPEGRVRILGRRDDVVKILGTLVSVPQVQSDLIAHGVDHDRVAVVAIPDERTGSALIAFTDGAGSLTAFADAVATYNAGVPGPQRIARACWVARIPRTDLGKIKRASLVAELGC